MTVLICLRHKLEPYTCPVEVTTVLTTGCWKVAVPLLPAPALKLASPAVVTCRDVCVPYVICVFLRWLQAA